jgi:type II secretory pathway pseudopilin PulG
MRERKKRASDGPLRDSTEIQRLFCKMKLKCQTERNRRTSPSGRLFVGEGFDTITTLREPATGGSRKPNAFTLAEVLISVLILATTMASLYACFSYSFTVIQSSREELRATQVALQKLEAIRLCTWNQLSNCPISFQENYDPLAPTNQSSGVVYYGTVTTGPCTNIPNSASYKTNMSLVTVALYWTNFNGAKRLTRSCQMQSQVALNGMQNYIWGATP